VVAMSYRHADKIAGRRGAPAAGEGESTPAIDPALYKRDDVRRVLAVRDIGALYRVLNDSGVNQRRIAALTGQSQSEVSEILKGRQVKAYDVLVRIAEGLGIPREYMGLSYGSSATYCGVVTAAEPLEEVDEGVLRRDLLAAGSVALVGAPVLGRLLDTPIVPGEMGLPSQVGMADVAEIKNVTEQLRNAARAQGGQARAVSAAALEYGRLTQVPAADAVTLRLSARLAELNILAGWCCYDSGLRRRARWHYRQAIDHATTAQDTYQLVDALQYIGILERAEGHPNDALKFYQLAEMRLGVNGDPGLLAWGHGLSALALANMGHPQATEQLAKVRDGWRPSSPFERADMDYQTALVYMELGDLDVAERFVKAINGAGRHRPVGTFAEILLATIHVRTGEPRGLQLAHNAITAATKLSSDRVRQRLLPLADELHARRGSDYQELARVARRVVTTARA
jgi:transcriptional regulator with XRE-family HTH domain/tetratricopeptide (TPR) repeat protein